MSRYALAEQIRDTLMQMAHQRGPEKTFCPSEVARAITNDWRELMPVVRAEAARLVAARQLRCLQQGRPADPVQARGPIRLSLFSDSA